MFAERNNYFSVFPLQRQAERQLRQETLKRKFGQSVAVAGPVELFGYPSPPMSSPPSPTQLPSHVPAAAPHDPTSPVNSYDQLPTTFAPHLPLTAPTTLGTAPTSFLSTAAASSPFASAPAVSPAQLDQGSIREAGQGTASASLAPAPARSTVTATSLRASRKSKAHVASACVNCKRAHLSCDVQRPCARCVASGKQDTCFDVAHKKRGRPRLREEGEFNVEQAIPAQSPLPPYPAGPSHTSARPIAEPRHRRQESFRSLRSQTRGDSPTYTSHTSSYPSSALLQSPVSYHTQPTPTRGRAPFELPTAFLDLDLNILKANRAFEEIIAGSQSLRGQQLADVVAPADNESLQTIRNRLRAEREAREPAYMPPILQAGQDLVQGVPEAEADQFTQGFDDYTYTWIRLQRLASRETFPARVRLAKSGIYFIVVTLPSFRLVEGPQQLALYPPPAVPFSAGVPLSPFERYPPPRDTASQLGPPFTSPPILPLNRSQPTSSRTNPASQTTMPFPQQMYPNLQAAMPVTSRLPVAESPADMTSFITRTSMQQIVQPSDTAELQLPPIMLSSAAGPSTRTTEVVAPPASESEEEGEEGGPRLRSPRKRRRMNIGDVLQR